MKLIPAPIRPILFGLLVSSLFPVRAFAQASSLSPFDAGVSSPASFKEVIAGSLRETSKVTVINPVNQVTFTTHIKTLGNVTFRFNREWHVPDVSYGDNGFSSEPLPRDGVHLQGTVELRMSTDGGARAKKTVPAAATIFNIDGNSPTIQISFLGNTYGDNGHFYKVSATLKNQGTPESVKVHRISQQAFTNRTCGLSAGGNTTQVAGFLKSPLTVSSPVRTNSTYLSFDIATEADYEWYARYGSSSNTKIQAILNQVQTIYQNQLNLTFSLTKQVVVTASGVRYTSSNVETLLSSFQSYGEDHPSHLGNADVYHLFTGKNTFLIDPSDPGTPNYSVIGLAYLGVVCRFPSYAYGLTEDLDDALNHVTTAHEIGHNFNAEHDAAGSIMGTTLNLNNPPTAFSTNSKNTIASWVASNSSCLTSSNATPTPTGGGSGSTPGTGDTSHASLSVSLRSNGNFTLSVGFSEIEAGCTATVRAASKAGRAYEGTVIVSPSTDNLGSTYRNIKIPRTVAQYISGTKRVQRVYFGVTKVCPSETYYSVTRSVSPYKIRSSRSAIKVGKWISTLAQKASAVLPE